MGEIGQGLIGIAWLQVDITKHNDGDTVVYNLSTWKTTMKYNTRPDNNASPEICIISSLHFFPKCTSIHLTILCCSFVGVQVMVVFMHLLFQSNHRFDPINPRISMLMILS